MRRQQEEANQQAEYQRELNEIYAKNVERERQLRQTKRLKDQEFKQEVINKYINQFEHRIDRKDFVREMVSSKTRKRERTD